MPELKISDANRDDIALWKNLQRYPAWKRVVNELREKVKAAELVIKMVGGDREVEFTKRDLAILQQNAYLDLIEMPDKMINLLSGTGQEKTENMDAYGDRDQEEMEDPNDDL